MTLSPSTTDRSPPFFATQQMRAVIDRVAQRVSLAPGAVLFRKGEDADSFYILDEGEIEISVTSADGKKLSLEILTSSEMFGEIGLFAGRRTADAMALTASKLRRVRRIDVLAAIRTEPDLALQMIELLCARLRSVSEKLEERAFLPLPARLARRFLHLADKYAERGGTIPMSQGDLADFAGATREAVAKTLAVWRARGWISMTRGAIRIEDRSALEILAASDED
jgi:CRP/FNR family cyclic AMP-dependent transcriptional regulator